MNSNSTADGDYVTVNGLTMYYEVHGQGEPLLLLHGGVGGIEMFGPNLTALAETRRVIGVDLQGHGRTSDPDRPMRFEQMADDIAGFLARLQVARTDVLGYSLGGGVAQQLTFRHPNAVRKLVLVSAACRRSAMYPEVLQGMAQLGPEMAEQMQHSPLSALYPTVDWKSLFTKLPEMLRHDYDWSAQVAAITSPVMLVFADADSIVMEHIVEFYRLLGGAKCDAGLDGSGRSANRLAIIPGATHYDICSTTALTAAVTPFLDTGRQQEEGA